MLVAYEGNDAVGCGAMKEFPENTMEIKRMYVPLEKRGKGIAKSILNELQKWAQEMGYKNVSWKQVTKCKMPLVYIKK